MKGKWLVKKWRRGEEDRIDDKDNCGKERRERWSGRRRGGRSVAVGRSSGMADGGCFFLLPFSGRRKRRQGQETKGGLNPHQIRPSFGDDGWNGKDEEGFTLSPSGVAKDSCPPSNRRRDDNSNFVAAEPQIILRRPAKIECRDPGS